jgi:hypothetical protein
MKRSLTAASGRDYSGLFLGAILVGIVTVVLGLLAVA